MKFNALILIINLFFFQSLFGNINNKIIVKVENEIITNYELKNKIMTSLILSNQEINQKNINDLKKIVLDQLIYLKLKKIEIEKYKIPKDQRQINSYLNSVSSNDVLNFKEKFLTNNLNFEIYLDEIDTEFRWQKLIYSAYQKKINISEDSVNKEIKEIIKNKKPIKEFELSEIEVNVSQETSIEDKIKEISDKIDTMGFENTALNFSSSSTAPKKGYLGWINEKALSKQIYEVVSKLNAGELSKPIKSQNSLLFLKLNKIRSLNSTEVDEEKLKKKIIEEKKNDLFNLYSQSRLSKLKNNSYIQYQ